MRRLLLLPVLLLAACDGMTVEVTATPRASQTPHIVTATLDTQATQEVWTPTREVAPTVRVTDTPIAPTPFLDCNRNATNNQPLNRNPCLFGENGYNYGQHAQRYQCYPNDYSVLVEYDYESQRTPPYINCRNTRFTVEVDQIDGRFGFEFDVENIDYGQCYIIKTVMSDQGVSLFNRDVGSTANIRYGATVSWHSGLTLIDYDLNTHPVGFGYQEFVFPFQIIGDGQATLAVWVEADHPYYAGSVTYDQISVFAVADSYCSGVQVIPR